MLQGATSSADEITSLPGNNILATWMETWSAKSFDKLPNGLGKKITGLMLFLQGSGDATVDVAATDTAVHQFRKTFSNTQLEYVRFDNVSHLPVLYAG